MTPREESTINPDLPTGEVELVADECVVECASEQTPIYLPGDEECAEEVRLKYRYLDLRRETLHNNIVLRSQIIAHLRAAMTAEGFNEYQTPILTCSSPEGARDYLVPSPRAPRQILRTAAGTAAFQAAPDGGRIRPLLPELPPASAMKMRVQTAHPASSISWISRCPSQPRMRSLKLWKRSWSTHSRSFSKKTVDESPWIRIPFKEAMLKYGSDKPDLRIPIEIFDCSDLFASSGFNAFAGAVKKGAAVRALPVKGIKGKSRSFFDKLVSFAQSIGSKGLAYLVWDGDDIKGPIKKFLSDEELAALAEAGKIEDGDVLFFVCDKPNAAAKIAGEIRTKLGNDLELIDKSVFKFCWIVDFPMFEEDEETGAPAFSHNPFSMPQGGMEALLNQDPLDVLAWQYDAVCNGVELSSGAIRNHLPEIMYKAFEIAGYGPEVVEEKFSSLLNAFKFGAPPHGGIAPGVDRMVMLLADEENIREVIAFPMNQKAQDLMMNAPAEVSERQLRELHIKIRGKNKQKEAES